MAIKVYRVDLSKTGLDWAKATEGDDTILALHAGLGRADVFRAALEALTDDELNSAEWYGPYLSPVITLPAQRAPEAVAV